MSGQERPEIDDRGATVSDETTMEPRTGSVGAAPQQCTWQKLQENPATREWLDLSRSVIEEKETKLLARALESGELTNLKVLFLEGNAGDAGVRAMLNALRAGHLKDLRKFILWEVSSYNQINTAEEGTDTIADALGEGLLPELDTMDLTGTLPKLIPARSFLETIKHIIFKRSPGAGRFKEGLEICSGCLFGCWTLSEKNQTLECLRCQFGKLQVYSGDDGILKIERALKLKPTAKLKILVLQQNYIRDKGASCLAKILRRGLLPNLDELDLLNNPVGREGAQKIVMAFLRNPLLTARVKLDCFKLDFLSGEKAVSFRDSNIRLEHRLDTLEIPHPRNQLIVINEYLDFQYYLRRPPRRGFRKYNHWLRLLCHAEFGNDSNGFECHKLVNRHDVEEAKGIEIRRPFFSGSSEKFVDRELEPESSGYDEQLCYSEDLSGQLYSGYNPTNDEFNSTTHSSKRKELVLKTRTAVNRIYITSKTFDFVAKAKALGSQIGREQSRRRQWSTAHLEKTKLQMDIIKLELLMLAERKPDEFYKIFRLRQVLLQNPRQNNLYSRVWICTKCFEKYLEQPPRHFGQPIVLPITTDEEIYPRGDARSREDNPHVDVPGLVDGILTRFRSSFSSVCLD